MSVCVGGMSWTVDIEEIPPPAPGWGTVWGEGRWEDNGDKICSNCLNVISVGKDLST